MDASLFWTLFLTGLSLVMLTIAVIHSTGAAEDINFDNDPPETPDDDESNHPDLWRYL